MAQQAYSGPRSASHATVSTVAIIGAGRVGTTLARNLVAGGLDVRVAGRGPREAFSMIVEVMAPGATAAPVHVAVDGADVVILAVPMHQLHTVDGELLDGRIVIDVMNYWEPIDGHLEGFAGTDAGTSPVVAKRLPGARIAKTFNHIGYHDIEADARPSGDAGRRALAVAGDDNAAVASAMAVVEAAGFDAVDVGGLDAGVLLEAGSPLFGARHTHTQVAALASRRR